MAAESLSFSDLSLGHSVCEVRYEMAFLIFDRTGAVCIACKEKFPEMKLTQASPSVTSFSVEKYSYWLGQAQSRVALGRPRLDLREFGQNAKFFFEIVFRELEVTVFTRLGLRQIYYRTFKDADGAIDCIKKLKLQYGSTEDHFGIKGHAQEAVFRWESEEHGTMLHFASSASSLVVATADIRQIEEGFEEKYKSTLVIDVDYYTKAPVLRSRWDAEEWIMQGSQVIKRGLRSILG
jgi:hypothetical protein